MYRILNFVLLLFLSVEGIRDLRKRHISMKSTLIFGVMAILLRIPNLSQDILDVLGGILIGFFLLFMAWITKEKIGYGDGWVFVVSGICLGFKNNMILLFMALFIAALVSAILLICKKVNKKTELPFVSFVMPAYCLLLLL